jgi:predicted SAM-dependent methyltransferase
MSKVLRRWLRRAQTSKLPHKLHIGPGKGWRKPDDHWLTVDFDPERGDIVANFNKGFRGFPLRDNSTACIYASHTFEHISVFSIELVMRECYRILRPGGYLRVITPNPKKSMEEYLKGNAEFKLFKRRIDRSKKYVGYKYTIFHALREDFISKGKQRSLLGEGGLAHQNAWDFDAMRSELCAAGFRRSNIIEKTFKNSDCPDFFFEGSYKSESNASYRSLYVEAKK